MRKLELVIRHSQVMEVKDALQSLGIHGMSMVDIKGFGRQGGHKEVYRGAEVVVEFVPKVKLEVVLELEMVEATIAAVRKAACTGEVGDGKIFVLPVEEVVRIRTGERGHEAM
ncbi:P-II family nitrogen regulator [Desulfococcaceae bacterium OttesenSCG-928-F15]|nr:P-II family nitrogen regulator [Desulfococcaceae bacterium OttesenSCG-928-F15]